MARPYIITAAVVISTLAGFLAGIAYQGSKTVETITPAPIATPAQAILVPAASAQLPAPQLENLPRPRTLAAAMAQASAGKIPRRAITSSSDAVSTPFGAYDSAIVAAISQRWYNLLDAQKYETNATGNVTVAFDLLPSGQVSRIRITASTVPDLLGYVCQEAITDSAPFAPWPSDMRRMVGANQRDIKFTFYYY